MPGSPSRARSRIHSYAVWDAAVFLLNVLAFLLMGLQAREIVAACRPAAALGGLGSRAVVVVIVSASGWSGCWSITG